MVTERKWFLPPEKVLLVQQAVKHSVLLEDIRMCLFWEGNTAKDLERKPHKAEEESQEDVGSAGG